MKEKKENRRRRKRESRDGKNREPDKCVWKWKLWKKVKIGGSRKNKDMASKE